MSFNERLKELRKECNLRQKDVAEDLNLTSSAIGFYEQGKRKPDYKILSELADYFEVSVDYLLGRTEKRQFYDKKGQKQMDKVKENAANNLYENNKISNRNELIILVEQAESLPPKAVKALIQFIKTIKEE